MEGANTILELAAIGGHLLGGPRHHLQVKVQPVHPEQPVWARAKCCARPERSDGRALGIKTESPNAWTDASGIVRVLATPVV